MSGTTPEFLTHVKVLPSNHLVFTTSYNRKLYAGPIHSYGGPGITSIQNGVICYANGITATVESAGLTITGPRGNGIDRIENGIVYYENGTSKSALEAGIAITGAPGEFTTYSCTSIPTPGAFPPDTVPTPFSSHPYPGHCVYHIPSDTVYVYSGSSWNPIEGQVGPQGRGILNVFNKTGTNDVTVAYSDGLTGSFSLITGARGLGIAHMWSITGTSEAWVQFENGNTGTLTVTQGPTGISINNVFTVTGTNNAIITYSNNTSGSLALPTATSVQSIYNQTGTNYAFISYSNNTSGVIALPTATSVQSIFNQTGSNYAVIAYSNNTSGAIALPTATSIQSIYNQTGSNYAVIAYSNNTSGAILLPNAISVQSIFNQTGTNNAIIAYTNSTSGAIALPTATSVQSIYNQTGSNNAIIAYSNNTSGAIALPIPISVQSIYNQTGSNYATIAYTNNTTAAIALPTATSIQSIFNQTGTNYAIIVYSNNTSGAISLPTATSIQNIYNQTGSNYALIDYSNNTSGAISLPNAISVQSIFNQTGTNSAIIAYTNNTSGAIALPTATSVQSIYNQTGSNYAIIAYSNNTSGAIALPTATSVQSIYNQTGSNYAFISYSNNTTGAISLPNAISVQSIFNQTGTTNAIIAYTNNTSGAIALPTATSIQSIFNQTGTNNAIIAYTNNTSGAISLISGPTGNGVVSINNGYISYSNGTTASLFNAGFAAVTHASTDPSGPTFPSSVYPTGYSSQTAAHGNLVLETTNKNLWAFNQNTNQWMGFGSTPLREIAMSGQGLNVTNKSITYISNTGTFSLATGSVVNIATKTIICDTPNNTNAVNIINSSLLNGTTVYSMCPVSNTVYMGGSVQKGLIKYDSTSNVCSTFTDPGFNGTVYTIASTGTHLYTGGEFTPGYISRFDTSTETTSNPFSTGCNGPVYSLALTGATLMVGGAFTSVSGATASRFATYNVLSNAWTTSMATTGFNGVVNSIAFVGPTAYIGGSFSSVNNTTINNIAQFNGTGFAGVGTGVDATVSALANVNTDLYVAGGFTGSVRQYDSISGTWSSPFTTGARGGQISTLSVSSYGPSLHIGGSFSSFEGYTTNNYIKYYIGSGFYTTSTTAIFGTGPASTDIIYTLSMSGTKLYCGGAISVVNGIISANCLALFDTSTNTWSNPFGSGCTGSAASVLPPVVTSSACVGTDVYIGGTFTVVNGSPIRGLARFNTLNNTWSSPFGAGVGITGGNQQTVNSIVPYTDTSGSRKLIVGGNFNGIDANAWINLFQYNIDANTISNPFGNVFSATAYTINAMTIYNNTLVVGGSFSTIVGNAWNSIAMYDLTTQVWSSPFTTQPVGTVTSLVMVGSQLYIGGAGLTSVNGVSCTNLIMYDFATNTVSNPFGTISDNINALTNLSSLDTSYVYVSGQFTTINGRLLPRFARWNITLGGWDYSFSPNQYPGNNLYTALLAGTDIYVGGSFTSVAGLTRNTITKFDGLSRTLSTVGKGFNGYVRAISPLRNSVTTNGLGWNGSFGTSINGIVCAITQIGRHLFVGGTFTTPFSSLLRYDTITQTYTSVTGWDNSFQIYCLESNGSTLFIGGQDTTGLTPRFSTYDLNTQQLNHVFIGSAGSGVNCFFKNSGLLYVCGNFNSASYNYLFTYNLSTGVISTMGTFSSSVNSIQLIGTKLWITGFFSIVNGQGSMRIVAYDLATSTWTYINNGPDAQVFDSAVVGTQLYLVGQFLNTAGFSSPYIAQFNTTTQTWSYPFGTGFNNWVQSIRSYGNYLYIGGYRTTTANGVAHGRMVRYNTTTGVFENVFGSGLGSSTDAVWRSSMYISGNQLYIGGQFGTVNSVSQVNLARWDLTTLTTTVYDNEPGAVMIAGSFTSVNNLLNANVVKIPGRSTVVTSKFGYNNALYTSCYLWSSARVDCSYNANNGLWTITNISGSVFLT